jgi:putative transposase
MRVEKRNFTVVRMARLLEVSRAGFYAWLKRPVSARAVRREHLKTEVTKHFAASDDVYGSPRILVDLREGGETVSRKTVATVMRGLGLVGVSPKQFKVTTVTDASDTYPVDAVQRTWDKGAVNRVWVGDITYLRTWQGWLYLATVIDAHSRRVIGWAIADHMRADLVEDALRMAIVLRGTLPGKVAFHTDRGTQYASGQVAIFTAANGITRSMGHTGVCWDNAMAESFFATLKTEFYYRRTWATKARAKVAVGDWIEDRYNRRRRHSALGHVSPVQFEMQYSEQPVALAEAA